MAPGRGADVPKRHFAELAGGCAEVILVCDRDVAYKCLAEDHGVIVLAQVCHFRAPNRPKSGVFGVAAVFACPKVNRLGKLGSL